MTSESGAYILLAILNIALWPSITYMLLKKKNWDCVEAKIVGFECGQIGETTLLRPKLSYVYRETDFETIYCGLSMLNSFSIDDVKSIYVNPEHPDKVLVFSKSRVGAVLAIVVAMDVFVITRLIRS